MIRFLLGHHSRRLGLSLACAVLSGCSSPERDWRKAAAAGTIEAYEEFLSRHPEGELADQAKAAKEKLDFDRAVAANSVAGFEEFLHLYPEGLLTEAATVEIEKLNFQEAQLTGTVEAYERFLRDYPLGAHSQQAVEAIDTLLPARPVIGEVEVTSAKRDGCEARLAVSVAHRSDAFTRTKPWAEGGVLGSEGIYIAGEAEVEGVESQDANHSVVRVKANAMQFYTDYGCSGLWSVGFSLMGQERTVSVRFP